MNKQRVEIYFKWIVCLVLLTVALDQLTKWLVLVYIKPFQLIPVIDGLFNLTLTFNKGIAFGLLAGVPDGMRVWLLVFTTGLALTLVVFFLLREYRGQFQAQQALAIIMGGAIGNIIDRLRIGKVVDFLDFFIGDYHWPAFNLADSAICVGVFYLIIFGPSPKESAQESEVVTTDNTEA